MPQFWAAATPPWRAEKKEDDTKNLAFNIRNSATGARTGTTRKVTVTCIATATHIAAWTATPAMAAACRATIPATATVRRIVNITVDTRVVGTIIRLIADTLRHDRTIGRDMT